MSAGENTLPPSWAWVPLGELGSWAGGGTPATENEDFWSRGSVPWVSPKDMKSFEIRDTEDHITEEAIRDSATLLLPAGTVLMVTRSGILRHTFPVAVSRLPVSLNQDLKGLTPFPGVSADFIAQALRSFGNRIIHACAKDGTTVQSIDTLALKRFHIPIAPYPEQVRVVDTLAEVISDLDAGIAALERVRAKLAQYRAAVLKAAVDGTLTAAWRAEHPNTEPATKLLERILAERRRRWEEEQLRKFKAKGQEPPKNWKAKYKEPSSAEPEQLRHLQDGWRWATVDQCAVAIQYGTSAKCTRDGTGVPVLRMGNMASDGRLSFTDLKYLPGAHGEFPDLLLQTGDILFNRTNSAELVGKTAHYSGMPAPCSFASYLIRLRLVTGVLPQYLVYCINSALGRSWIKEVANQTVGQANVNGTKLAAFVFPIPAFAEQSAVVDAVDDQFSVIDDLESDLDTKLKSAQGLRQAILRHAFTGQLVPQDPNDEPASDLLKRIAAMRDSRARDTPHIIRPPVTGARQGTRVRSAGHRHCVRQPRHGGPRRRGGQPGAGDP